MSTAEISPLVAQCINELCRVADEQLQGAADEAVMPSEAALSQRLAVSRTPLRQALEHLEATDLLRRDGRRRLVLRAPRDSDRIADVSAPESKADHFERFFLHAVAERELRPGQSFTEVELAEAAGVSTLTVREVLARYEVRRLITKEPRKSWRMVRFDQAMVDELWELRRLVEHRALQRLCETGEQETIARLLREHQDFAARKRGRMATWRDLDRRFHAMLFASCGNRFLDDFRGLIDLLIHVQLADDVIGREGLRRGLDEHTRILQAVLDRRFDDAQRIMGEHLDSSHLIMSRSLSRDHQPDR